jgi:tight adherence protein C
MSGSGLLYAGLGSIVVALVAVAAAVMPKRQGQPSVSQALATIEKRYGRHSAAGPGHADPRQLPGWLRDLAIRLSPAGAGSTMQRRLDTAGNPERWTSDRMLTVKALGLIVLGVVGASFGLHDPALLVLGFGVGAAAGFFLPDLLLYNAGLKRQQKIPLALPDALDLLTICVEAGLGFDAALAQVARNTQGPLAAEFSRVLQEMQFGKSRPEAIRAMAERCPVPELRSFVSALVQSTELGIPVGDILREQAKEMRVRRRQRAEAAAQKVPVKITIPLILCLFPALLVAVMGPGAIEIAHTLFQIFRK